MLFVFMHHSYGMFRALSYHLQHLMPIHLLNSEDVSWSTMEKISYDSIVMCVKRHNSAIEFATLIESYYQPAFTVSLVTAVLVLSPSLYQLVTANFSDYIACVQLLVVVIYFFIISYYGQKLINYSGEILKIAYCTDWYCYSPRVRRVLILIIRRCDKPSYISAYKLYTLSFDCFRMVMQAGLSFSMLLREI
ncbi:odorant receptor coreceptor-like [Prorops nasuta]|uniref:odorant receptor coreceptor-like n=1 Tax=Prorops nasuta TaxID=863751 RepID=UPI0034CFCA15